MKLQIVDNRQMSTEPITLQNVKDVELDLNKALQVMLNGLEVARRQGKYTFEEGYFVAQALYGLNALSNGEKNKPLSTQNGEKVMRVTWPEDFTLNDYVQVVIRHLELGQQRGAFSFTEATLLGRAIEMFHKPTDIPTNTSTSNTNTSTSNTNTSTSNTTNTASVPQQQTIVL